MSPVRTPLLSISVIALSCGGEPEHVDGGAADATGAGSNGADSAIILDAGKSDGADVLLDAGAGPMDAGQACTAPVLPALEMEPVAEGHLFRRPVFVAQPPGRDDTLWVVERTGAIQRVTGDALDGTVVTIPDLVVSDVERDERGLLGLAFHPEFESTGLFYVMYTRLSVPTYQVLAEYRDDGNPETMPVELRRLIDEPNPDFNHNGGMLEFGPDGFLYVGIGDGGTSCDQRRNNGQRLDTIFGKILRLDVTRTVGDLGAAGNPFSLPEGRPEIWSYGLRNPWRFSFDRLIGDLYIGDVGQRQYEELDIQPASSTGGENYGWRLWEGATRSSISSDCDDTGWDSIDHRPPDLVLDHDLPGELLDGACSIIGGYVYRGAAIPELSGVYLFGDFCSPHIGALRYCDGEVVGAQRVTDLTGVGDGLASFGQDEQGELYLVFIDGAVQRLVRQP